MRCKCNPQFWKLEESAKRGYHSLLEFVTLQCLWSDAHLTRWACCRWYPDTIIRRVCWKRVDEFFLNCSIWCVIVPNLEYHPDLLCRSLWFCFSKHRVLTIRGHLCWPTSKNYFLQVIFTVSIGKYSLCLWTIENVTVAWFISFLNLISW